MPSVFSAGVEELILLRLCWQSLTHGEIICVSPSGWLSTLLTYFHPESLNMNSPTYVTSIILITTSLLLCCFSNINSFNPHDDLYSLFLRWENGGTETPPQGHLARQRQNQDVNVSSLVLGPCSWVRVLSIVCNPECPSHRLCLAQAGPQ